jgi:hypothetical protein
MLWEIIHFKTYNVFKAVYLTSVEREGDDTFERVLESHWFETANDAIKYVKSREQEG